MKRFFLAILFLSSFGFSLSAFAYDFPDIPYPLPYEYDGVTYDYVVQAAYGDNSDPYMAFSVTYCQSADSVRPTFRQRNYGGYIELDIAPGSHCVNLWTIDSNYTWDTWHYVINNNQEPIAIGQHYGIQSQLIDLFRATVDLNYSSWSEPNQGFDFNGNFGLYSVAYNETLIVASSFGGEELKQLSITRSPQSGGGVVITHPDTFEYNCGVDSEEECEFDDLPYNSQVTLEAQANSGYAFSHWEINNQTMGNVDGEITIAMSENKVVKAVYNRTFQDAVDNFDVTTGDECVLYIRNETGIIYDACHGDAADCFEQAQMAGYATGSEPRESAIIVFDRVPDTALAVGHVGIVTSYNGDYVSIHDSNWVGYHTIGDHTELIGENGYNIKGYIYFAPHQ